MTDQTDPVSRGEWILRRVPYIEINGWIDPQKHPPISNTAFKPTNDDHDGLSLFRELFITPQQIADRHRELKQKECYVIRIKASILLDIGITLSPNPIDDLPGHALIPELNTERYKSSDKALCLEIQTKISEPLTTDNIAHWPVI